jgi:hypothetical protein
MKLNLTTNCTEHTVLKEYLEENASAILADKINHGVFIEKDGKRLLNRKDLNGFMVYACDEARKLAAKGAKSACLKSDIVFGWAIHYFEEDEIIGKLFNEDGSEYTPPKPEYKPIQRVPAPTVPAKPEKPKPAQASLFDFLASAEQTKDEPVEEQIEEPDEEEPTELEVDKETGEVLSIIPFKVNKPNSIYERYLAVEKQYPHAVIAYRLGDFYEVFGDKAVLIAKELDLTLTGRNCGLEERVPMIGFPYHASDSYFRKIRTRHQLVIMEDGEVQVFDREMTKPVPAPPSVLEESEPVTFQDDDDDFEEELKRQQYFDKDALCILYELFDGDLDMQ